MCIYNRFNTLIKPINSLLRQTENINLAPEILEPSPQNVSVLVSLVAFYQEFVIKELVILLMYILHCLYST